MAKPIEAMPSMGLSVELVTRPIALDSRCCVGFGEDLGAGDGQRSVGAAGAVDAEADEALLGLAPCFHAGDDFLPEIAALGEAHSVAEDAGLVGQVLLVEVEEVEGRARFDAGDVAGVPAGGPEAGAFGEIGLAGAGVGDGVEDGRRGGGFAGEFQADLAEAVTSFDEHLVVGDADEAGQAGQEAVGGGAVGVGRDRGEEHDGGGAVEAQAVEGLADVGERDVFGEEVAAEGLGGVGGAMDIEIEAQRIGQRGDADVDAALAAEPEALAAVPGLEAFEFLGEHAVEELDAVVACDVHRATVWLVEEDAALAERGVLDLEGAEGFDEIGGFGGVGGGCGVGVGGQSRVAFEVLGREGASACHGGV